MMKIFSKSLYLSIAKLFVNATPIFANNSDVSTTVIGNGIGIGSALPIAICWTRTNSVITSILAGFFGWFYVIYYLIIRENKKRKKINSQQTIALLLVRVSKSYPNLYPLSKYRSINLPTSSTSLFSSKIGSSVL